MRNVRLACAVAVLGWWTGMGPAQTGTAPATASAPTAAATPFGEAEPLYHDGYREGAFCRYKSPGPGMRFTQGVALRVLADAVDPGGWAGKTKKSEAEEVRFFVDGKLQAKVEPAPDGYNYFETTFKDLAVGPHVLTAESTNHGGVIRKSVPVQIVVEAPATRAKTVNLTQDLVLTGSADLAWEDATVNGNGFRVTSEAKWTGSVVIRKCLVMGLGSRGAAGIDVATRGGSVSLEDTIYDGTGAVFLRVDGTGAFTVRNNEFRSSNLLQFVSSNPGKSPIFRASGGTTGSKVFQGNRVGAGIVLFEGMTGWLIGGDSDSQSNILIGPRCVLTLDRCRDAQVRGNYIHHDYYGGWSQGFNLVGSGSSNLLAEHNILRDSSWVVQSFPGEFRYNLVVNSGHNWIRSLATGAKVHHNVFVHAVAGGGVNAGIWTYLGEKDVAVYNNTFDGGAPLVRSFAAPIIEVSPGCRLASLRNNVFTGVAAPENVAPRPVVARGGKDKEKDTDPRIAYADYNCFHNPQVAKAACYADGIVEGKPAGGGGAHDVLADPKFAQGAVVPYPVNQAGVWNRTIKVSQILAYYRQRYAPADGSPLIGAGDPADGKGSFIGAVDAGADAPNDHFGRFGTTTGPSGSK
jgi:hypothetical protein